MRSTLLLIGLLLTLGAVHADDEINDQTARRLTEIYSQVLSATHWDVGPLEGKFKKLPDRESFSVTYITSAGRPNKGRLYSIYSSDIPINLLVDPKNFNLYLIHNRILDKYLDDNSAPRQSIPAFTIEKAVQTARQYLEKFGMKLPSDCVLGKITFNESYPSQWEIRWKRTAGVYLYDDFAEPYAEDVVVTFHEVLGLTACGSKITTPPPKSLEVKMSRDEAIIKASKCAPSVFRSPYYRQARADGFIIKDLKSCELKVAVPNWLLDPKRAIWHREKPGEENRLCWIVRFTTVDTKADTRGSGVNGKPLKLIPPDVLIYIDAATGECVGANFT